MAFFCWARQASRHAPIHFSGSRPENVSGRKGTRGERMWYPTQMLRPCSQGTHSIKVYGARSGAKSHSRRFDVLSNESMFGSSFELVVETKGSLASLGP